ncbi:MAG: hypothetical protein ACI909_004320 [Planctomycetota bacterium]|jgi:hypothetical protein
MAFLHLKPDILIDYIHGRQMGAFASDHLRQCVLCQARVLDERLIRALLTDLDPAHNTVHLSAAKLAAYVDNKLPSEELTRTAEHIVRCDDCLTAYLDITGTLGAPEETVPQKWVSTVLKKMRPPSLGTVQIYPAIPLAGVVFIPISKRVEGIKLSRSVQTNISEISSEKQDHVFQSEISSLEKPMSRHIEEENTLWDPATTDDIEKECLINIFDHVILLIQANETHLMVKAMTTSKLQPVKGLILSLHCGDQVAESGVTDLLGRAELPLPDSALSSRLEILKPISASIGLDIQ